jgi:hypothetical protein
MNVCFLVVKGVNSQFDAHLFVAVAVLEVVFKEKTYMIDVGGRILFGEFFFSLT